MSGAYRDPAGALARLVEELEAQAAALEALLVNQGRELRILERRLAGRARGRRRFSALGRISVGILVWAVTGFIGSCSTSALVYVYFPEVTDRRRPVSRGRT